MLAGVGLAFAQTAAFDAATIRPAAAGANSGGAIRPSPGGLNGTNMTLKSYLEWAWDLRPDFVYGPDWLGSERFDITARAQGPFPVNGVRLMLRSLLEERFHLVAHRETKELSVYTLVVPRGGPKHMEKAAPDSQRGMQPGPAGPDGENWIFHNMPMASFVASVGGFGGSSPDRPVIDATGLEGGYDFNFSFPPREPDVTQLEYKLSVVFPAVYDQLGLRIEPRKAPVEVLVIDSADKAPSTN